MGALVDQCPDCGKFVAKGASMCPNCEAEMPEVVESAEPAPEASVAGRWREIGRVAGGALVGALLAGIVLGAGDARLAPGMASARDPAPTAEVSQPPPQTPSVEANSAPGSETPEAGRTPERRARLIDAVAAIRAELSRWAELYQMPHRDVAQVLRRLTELERLIEQTPGGKE